MVRMRALEVVVTDIVFFVFLVDGPWLLILGFPAISDVRQRIGWYGMGAVSRESERERQIPGNYDTNSATKMIGPR